MKSVVIVFIIFGSFIMPVHAQSLFEYDRVDFFNSIEPQEKVPEPPSKEKPDVTESEWAEPIISPSGNVAIYVPPKEVRDFLDKPDPESAKAYLNWNMNRIKKFITAQQLLENEAKAIRPDKDLPRTLLSSPNSERAINDFSLKGNCIFYFMLKGCPACLEESKVIKDIYLKHPEIKIEAFADGLTDDELKGFVFPVTQNNGMSQRLRINSYPTIIVFNEKKERYLISGYVDKEKILRLF